MNQKASIASSSTEIPSSEEPTIPYMPFEMLETIGYFSVDQKNPIQRYNHVKALLKSRLLAFEQPAYTIMSAYPTFFADNYIQTTEKLTELTQSDKPYPAIRAVCLVEAPKCTSDLDTLTGFLDGLVSAEYLGEDSADPESPTDPVDAGPQTVDPRYELPDLFLGESFGNGLTDAVWGTQLCGPGNSIDLLTKMIHLLTNLKFRQLSYTQSPSTLSGLKSLRLSLRELQSADPSIPVTHFTRNHITLYSIGEGDAVTLGKPEEVTLQFRSSHFSSGKWLFQNFIKAGHQDVKWTLMNDTGDDQVNEDGKTWNDVLKQELKDWEIETESEGTYSVRIISTSQLKD